MTNRIFQFLALVIAAVAVYVFWDRRDNGRYVYHEEPATQACAGSMVVLDSRTGVVFALHDGKFLEMDFRSGSMAVHEPNKKNQELPKETLPWLKP